MADHIPFIDSSTASTNLVPAAWFNDVNDSVYQGKNPSFVTSTGSANAYVVTLPSSTLTVLEAGQLITFKANFTNSGAATLEVVGSVSTGAVALQAAQTALSSGAITSGDVVLVCYANSVWNVLATSTSGGTSSFTNIAVSSTATITTLNVSGVSTLEDVVVNGDLTFGAAGTINLPDASVEVADLSNSVLNLILASGSANSTTGGIASGNGRLTLTSNTPILTSDVTGATTVYYYGTILLLWDSVASAFQSHTITQLSQTLADSTKSPAASAANANYDIFGWLDGVTYRISRGPLWRNAGQAITGATNATPIVITANSHGLSNGDSVEVASVAGNTAANGVWTVANVAANTFELATSVGNAAYTSGGSFASRGTGASTTELELLGSSYVNKIAITNGPTARNGTYLGTIHTNASNQLDWKFGGIAAGGSPGYFSVWNVSNRVNISSVVLEDTASWTYGASVARPMNNSTSNRISFVRGLNSDPVEVSLKTVLNPYNGLGSGNLVGLDSITDQAVNSTGAFAGFQDPDTAAINMFNLSVYSGLAGLGFHFAQALEVQGTPAIGAATWYGKQTAYTTAPVYETAFFASLTA